MFLYSLLNLRRESLQWQAALDNGYAQTQGRYFTKQIPLKKQFFWVKAWIVNVYAAIFE